MGKKKRKKAPKKPPRKVYQPRLSRIRPLESRQAVLERASEKPFVGCWRHVDWQQTGITPIVIAREQSETSLVVAHYLVDLYCLGVKDAFVQVNVPRKGVLSAVRRSLAPGEEEPCDIAFAHRLIYGAIEFARKYGLEPHADFYRLGADKVLDPPGTHPETYDLTFGKDGKPFYIPGPHDSPSFVRRVLNTLERNAPGEYDYVMILDELPDML